MGELTRWMQNLERRMGEMHGENRAGLLKIENSVSSLAELQRVQNGNVARQEGRIGVIETRLDYVAQHQRTTDQEIDTIQRAATNAAAGAASQAIFDVAPAQKRLTAIAALGAGVTTGGLFTLYWIGKTLVDAMMK